MADVREKGEEMIEQARKEGRRIIVLVGRPYHVDPEINHGIDKLIAGFGAAVVTEAFPLLAHGEAGAGRAQPVDIPRPPVRRRALYHHRSRI